jgi:hypothetical protein
MPYEYIVTSQLLTATCKLFFKRPGECQPILGSLLKQLIQSCDNCDLRSRAVMYYNLLRTDVGLAQEIIAGNDKAPSIDVFYEDEDNEKKEKIAREFNTFSVIYQEPQEKFLKKELVQKILQEEMATESKEAKLQEKILQKPQSPHPAPPAVLVDVGATPPVQTASVQGPGTVPAPSSMAKDLLVVQKTDSVGIEHRGVSIARYVAE